MKRVFSIVTLLALMLCAMTQVAMADMVISNDNENTSIAFGEPGFVYVEFVQGENRFPINTGGGFIVSTVTAEDADGNALGQVYATDGTIDYSMYLGQAVRLHIVNSYTDEYLLLNNEGGEGAAAPPADSEGSAPPTSAPAAPAVGMHPLTIFGLVVLVIMIAIILTASITCIRENRKKK